MLHQRVNAVIRQERLIDPEDRVLVGASGGIDSSVLLFVLLKIKDSFPFSLGVAHLNHGLRGAESVRDEEFVRGLAEKFGLPFQVRRVDVRSYAKAEGLSLQHAGRNLRYAYFREIAREHTYQKIAIGHTRDDQVETFVMRIIKGTGLRGLSSIPIRRGQIIRPLLFCYRPEIEAYLREECIPYVEDSSNQKDIYQRNFIRNRVLPLFEKLNPNFRERVLFLLNDLTRLNGIFEEEANRFLHEEVHTAEGDIVVEIERLKRLHPETRYRVLSGMLEQLEPGLIPLRDHIRLIEKVLESPRPNIDVALPDRVTVTKTYDRLKVTKKLLSSRIQGRFPVRMGFNPLEPFGIILECAVTETLPQSFPDDAQTAFFDYDKTGALHVRTFVDGDRFVPLGMQASVKLKDFFISRKIPLHQRRRLPLLISGEDIIWVVGQRIDERYKVTESTRRVLKATVRPAG
ncbi:MAG TPA: tRNA lysidine(34) synthetase TilS [Syntrophorhabdales bacterium]|nr:tRNA lysidine(34) synthetase TilS [Syntrophorhabdales bacterium]